MLRIETAHQPQMNTEHLIAPCFRSDTERLVDACFLTDHERSACVVTRLLNAKADPNSKDIFGRIPAHITCTSNNFKSFELLIAGCARNPIDFAIFLDMRDNYDQTIIHKACRYNNPKSLALLIDIYAEMTKGRDSCELRPITHYLNALDDFHNTPMHHACKHYNLKPLAILIAAGADLCVQNASGHTPTHLACLGRFYNKAADVMLAAGAERVNGPADFARFLNVKAIDDNTIAHLVSRYRQHVTLKLLIDTGADLNVQNIDGLTPTHIYCNRGDIKGLELLIDAGVDIDLEDAWGHTPKDTVDHRREFSTLLHTDKQRKIPAYVPGPPQWRLGLLGLPLAVMLEVCKWA